MLFKVISLVKSRVLITFLLTLDLFILINPGFTQNTKAYTGQSVGFIENKGQVVDQDNRPNPAVRYLFNCGNGLNVQLRANGFSYDTYTAERVKNENEIPLSGFIDSSRNYHMLYHFHRVDVELVNAASEPEIIAEAPSADYFNYYNAVTPEEGVVFVRSWQKVTYKNIYPGIDLEFVINKDNKTFKYNFIVHPGADASLVRLKYNGALESGLSGGKIAVKVAQGLLYDSIPSSKYMESDKQVHVVFISTGSNEFGFRVPEYDRLQTLIIDPAPVLVWGTYYGATGDDYGNGICTNNKGSIYIVGSTRSTTNIATSGSWQSVISGSYHDVFVLKFNMAGQRIWGTYYGGTEQDYGNKITYSSGYLFITGSTGSTSGMVTSGSHQSVYGGGYNDVFIAKFDTNGQRLIGTYLGGSDLDNGYDISADLSGNIVVTGGTKSNAGISTPGSHQASLIVPHYDAFIVKFNNNLARLWGTYYGSYSTHGNGITTDKFNNIVVIGYTESLSSIATPGAYQTDLDGLPGGGSAMHDAFIVKFNSSGQRLWGTYYGGDGGEDGNGIATDITGNIYVTGFTASNGLASPGAYQPNHGGGQFDLFIAKFNINGQRLWGTYYGGNNWDFGNYITTDPAGNIIVTGKTESDSNIASPLSHQQVRGGWYDAFLVKFNPSGARIWGTYYGGGDDDCGNCCTVCRDYIFVTGQTYSTNSIATAGAHQTSYSGYNDAFIAKFINCYPDYDTVSISVCDSFDFNGRMLYNSGTYFDTLISTAGCDSFVTLHLNIIDAPATRFSINDSIQCRYGNYFSFTDSSSVDSGTISYYWYFGDNDSSQISSPSHSYLINDTFFVTLVTLSVQGCVGTLVKPVIVNPVPEADFTVNNTVQCFNENVFIFDDTSTISSGSVSSAWDFGDLDTASGDTVLHTYKNTGSFLVRMISLSNHGCSDTSYQTVVVNHSPLPEIHIIPYDQCLNKNDFIFYQTGKTSRDSFSWNLGDGNKDTSSLLHHTYLSAGTFIVSLAASNIFGCKDTVFDTVEVFPVPDAFFTISDTVMCLDHNRFVCSNAVQPNIYKRTWEFGDGQTDSLATVSHAYLLPGSYTVKLTVENSFHCRDSFTGKARVLPLPSPAFSINDSVHCLKNNLIVLSGNDSLNNRGKWYWNFGDGHTDSSRFTSHSYIAAGNYVIWLKTVNEYGCMDSVYKNVAVLVSPSARFSVNDSVQCFKNNNFVFNNLSSGASAYLWNFGDYITDVNFNAVHSYVSNGFYNVMLIASEGKCRDTFSKTVRVNDSPFPPSISSNSPVCEGEELELTAMQTGNTLYHWYSYHGFSSNQPDPVIFPAKLSDSGFYYLKITVWGCESDSVSIFVVVNPVPQFDLGTDKTICSGDIIVLDPGNFDSYLWQDLSTGRTYNVTEPGLYGVTVTNQYGCPASDSVRIGWKCPTMIFIPTAFSPNGDGNNDSFTIVAQNIQDPDLCIYDRWGELVFRSSDPDLSWDGTYKGTACPAGVYYYHFIARDEDGKIKKITGTITLLK